MMVMTMMGDGKEFSLNGESDYLTPPFPGRRIFPKHFMEMTI